jgi:putative phosphoesterase
MSDSHGNALNLRKCIEKNIKSDIFLFAGDCESEILGIIEQYPYLDIRAVRGNNDYNPRLPQDLYIDVTGAKILLTHGNKYTVDYYGTDILENKAREKGCNIVVFGHTHTRLNEYHDGIYFLNPGSIARPRDFKPPSYGYIDITPQGIVTNVIDL